MNGTFGTDPNAQQHIESQTAVANEHLEVFRVAETEFWQIMGKELNQRNIGHSRCAGPRFVWRSPLDTPATASFKTTMASRAWRTSAAWLKRIIHHPGSSVAWKCNRNLMFFKHDFPRTPDTQQFDDFQLFTAWRDMLTWDMLGHDAWAKTLFKVAGAQAAVLEDNAYKRSFADWLSWLQEGPANGLGRKHRMSKCALGWTPTKQAVSVDNILSDLDSTEGLSPEQLDIDLDQL